jgi:glycogen debranching enzyme
MSWIDTTCQQVLANRCLIRMAGVLGREQDVAELVAENERLTAFVNAKMWHRRRKFYADRFRDGKISDVKTIGAYWALFAGLVPSERLDAFVAHLCNKREFNRPHRVPSLSADNPHYVPDGGYWNGAVWAPTNYMVLRGLTGVGQDALAHEIACNHVANVVAAFVKQGTLFENYAAEKVQGNCAKDFVGWTGVPPITVLFEYVFGLRPDVGARKLLWDVRLIEEHGVERYPFGKGVLLDLHCAARQSPAEEPQVQVRGAGDVEVLVTWAGGQTVVRPSTFAQRAQ